MHSEDKFWVAIWSLLAITLISLSIIGAIYFNAKSTKWVEALVKADNPVAVACALKVEEGDQNMPQVCTLAITK